MTEEASIYNGLKIVYSINGVGKIGQITCRKMKWPPSYTTHKNKKNGFKSLIYFEYIIVCDVRRLSSFIFLHVSVHFSQHYLLNKPSLAHCMCCFLCQILIDYNGVGLFLDYILCSIDPCTVFMPIPCCFDYYGLIVQFDIK